MGTRKSLLMAFTIAFLTVTGCFAQKTIPIDYFEALSFDGTQLQKYMTKLGFESKSIKKDHDGFDCSWGYKRLALLDSTKTESSLHIYFEQDNTKSLSFQTYEKEDYIRFKKALSEKGLKLQSKKTYSDFVLEFFCSDRYESNIYSREEDHVTLYDINLKKIK